MTTTVVKPTATKSRVTPAHAIKDMWIITKRNLRRFIRMPQLLLVATVQPVMFLLLFNFVFGGAISLPGVSYIDFLLPGILVQTVMFGATNTATGLTEDLAAGVIDRFRSLPMARGAVLAGRTLADLMRSAAVNTLMIFVGYLIGFRPSGIPQLLLGLILALMFGYSMSWVFAAVGLVARTPEAAQSASFLLVFPFVFASSVFVPVQSMPGWLQVFAENQPVSVLATTVRGLTIGIEAMPSGKTIEGMIALSIAWIIGIFVVASPLSVNIYRRIFS
jgi:ABC transporter DrrB family efflux protein